MADPLPRINSIADFVQPDDLAKTVNLELLSKHIVDGFLSFDTTALDATFTIATPAPSTLVMSAILFGMFGVVWSYKRMKRPT